MDIDLIWDKEKQKTIIDPDMHNFVHADSTCSFCGDLPNAMWCGNSEVFVCLNCAIKVLPCLIADSVASTKKVIKPILLESAIKDAVSTFWRAATIASYRKANKVSINLMFEENEEDHSD